MRKNNFFDMSAKRSKKQISNASDSEIISSVPEKHLFTRFDFILLLTLIITYSIIAFYNLGSMNSPETYWKTNRTGSSFCINFGKIVPINRIAYFEGIGDGQYIVNFSNDLKHWSGNCVLNPSYVFTWNIASTNIKARYARVTANTTGAMLNEIGFYGNDKSSPIHIDKVYYNHNEDESKQNALKAIDEQKTVQYSPTYKNGTYFDEIYHARTAYEFLHNLQPYETTHPPLGKIIISIGIALFGMNPFGWRVMGTVFGILMIPLMYFWSLKLFNKTELAFLSTFLLTFDFMHFVQSRISTIDVFAVFFIMITYYFMFCYAKTNFYRDGLRKSFIPLGLTGLFWGLGVATKWICIYSSLGLAIIFLYCITERYKEYKKSFIKKKPYKNTDIELCSHIQNTFKSFFTKTILFSILFFIIIPVIIYCGSYIPFFMVPNTHYNLGDIINWQKDMYNYHTQLNATHPFSSEWYDWPAMAKPVWYYTGQNYLKPGYISSIVSFGNPAVWWIGTVAAVISIVIAFMKKDKLIIYILIGLFSEYLPWIFVTRLTFIYHFWASIPFLVLCIVYVYNYFREKYNTLRFIYIGYISLVLILFIMFYPILSGMIVTKDYASCLKWFNGWYFYS